MPANKSAQIPRFKLKVLSVLVMARNLGPDLSGMARAP
jgi:hypothetical protein